MPTWEGSYKQVLSKSPVLEEMQAQKKSIKPISVLGNQVQALGVQATVSSIWILGITWSNASQIEHKMITQFRGSQNQDQILVLLPMFFNGEQQQ